MNKRNAKTRRSPLRHLALSIVLLFSAAVLSSGCAVHASPYGIHAHGRIAVRIDAPPPPPPPRVKHTCTSQRMCNIWGVCSTRTVCSGQR